MQQYRKNLGKVSLTAEGAWKLNKEFEVLSIVYDEHTQHGFISKKDVPVGVDLYNAEYWMPLNVSGYIDSNIIILNDKTSEANIKSYTLKEAINSVAAVGRKPGAMIAFYNENTDRLDIGGRWEIWQYNAVDNSNWENVECWQSLYYNYNKFVGWYRSEELLKANNPFPEIGCYAFVGTQLNEATIYRCDRKYVWEDTTQHAWDYVKVIVDGNVTVGENGNWFNNGVDTNIPASIKGENGKTPLFRNNNNVIEVSYDNVEWNPISDEIAAWFRWQSEGGQQVNSVGKIQITRNGVTWTDLSGQFVNNLRISRYIGVDESLPTSGIVEGTIYAKGPTYSDEDISHANPIYRLWVYAWKGNTLAWVDNGEFQSIVAGVTQETGDSETEVMSQKAVTTKLSELGLEVRNVFTIKGAISPVNGAVIPDTTFVCTPFIKISNKREIDLCAYDGGNHSVYCLVNYYDSDYKHISSIKYNEGNAAFIEKVILSNEIPEDAVFFRATSISAAASSNRTYIKGVVISSAENISNIYESVLSLNKDVDSLKESDKNNIKKEDISQSVGSSESSIMSQKIVTDLIPTNKLFSEIGLLLSDGTINVNQTSWRVTPYIHVEEKEVFVQGYSGGKVYTNYPLLCAYDKDYKLLESYGNEAETDGVLNLRIELPSNTQYIRVSARERDLNESFVVLDYYNKIVTNNGKQQLIDNIVLRGLSTRHYANKEGFIFNINGYIANASYKSSELIKVKAGDILELTTNSNTGELVIWGLETRFFSTGKTLVNKPINGQANRYTIIVPNGVNYICFNCRIGYDGYVDVYSECAKKVEELENNQYEKENVPIYVGSYIIQPSTGKATILEGAGTSMFIPVKEGDVYYYSGRASAYNLGVAGYSIVDGNVSLVSKIIYNAEDAIIQQEECSDVEFTIPSGVEYIGCSTRNQDTFPLSLKKKVNKLDKDEMPSLLLSYDKIQGSAINSISGSSYIISGGEATNFIQVEEGDLIKVYGYFGSQSGVAGYDENKDFKISIADASSREGLHYIIREARGQIIKIPRGVKYIRVSTTNRDDYAVEVRKLVSVKEIVENSYNYNSQLKYVWFGDSISQLGSLPHQTCKKMGVDVVDVSFAGAPLTYSTEKYQNTGFMGLVDCIVNNDFTPTETALQLQEEGGTDISHKIVNLNNLKSVNWASVTHVVVLAGTNDLSFSAATIERIKEGLSSAISKLVAKYPHLTLYFVSPPFRGNIQGVQGLNLLDINKAIEEVCKDFNFPFFDFFHNCGVNSVNKGYYMDAQELHPNIEGERLWTTKIANWLQSL